MPLRFQKFEATSWLYMGRTSFYQWNKETEGFFFPLQLTELFPGAGKLTHHQTHLLWPCTATCPATAGCNNRLWVILSLIHGTFGGIVWGIKTLTCQIQADGHLPTLKTAFPVKQANICILLLQHSKYYKQQPVKNDLNCSKEPLDSFLAFGLLK